MKKYISLTVLLMNTVTLFAQKWELQMGDSIWNNPEDNLPNIQVISIIDDTMYISGAFRYPCPGYIAKRNNFRWTCMGTGLYGGVAQVISKYQNKILVGGLFLTAGNLNPWTSGSAYWDGVNWTYTGFQVGHPSDFYPTDTLLFIATSGDGNTIKTWDGTTLLDGTTGTGCPYSYEGGTYTVAFTKFNDTLYAGSENYLYKYLGNRCWVKLNVGPWGEVDGLLTDTINNLMYTSGHFYYIYTENQYLSSSFITMYDGYRWHPFGDTLYSIPLQGMMATYRGDLYVSTIDTNYYGNVVNYIIRWDGNRWHKLGNGLNNNPVCLKVYHDSLWVGGYFSQINVYMYHNDSIVPQHACGLAKWYMPPDTGCHYVQPFIYSLKNGTPKDTFYLGTQHQAMVQFYNNNPYAYHWYWDFGDGTTDTVRNPTHIYTVAGNYNVTLTINHPQEKPLTGNCIKTVHKTVTVLNGTEASVNDMLSNFKLYPNPTTGDLNLECVLNENKDGKLVVNSEKGDELYRNIIYPGYNHLIIPSSQWSAGLLIVNIFVDNSIIKSEKVLKQ